MSDETPGNDTPGDEKASDETQADTPTTEQSAAPAPAPAPSGGSSDRSGIFVPKWLAGVLAALLLVGAGFAIGRVTDSGSDHHDGERAEQGPRAIPRPPTTPRDNGDGNGGNGNGNGGGSNPQPAPSGVFLGVAARDASGNTNGAEVIDLVTGGPADKAGIQSGDVITKVDGDAVSSAQELGQAVQSHSTGDEVTITYVRNGTSTDVKVTLGDRGSASSGSGSGSSNDSTN
jgi:membrane-associated protease RseP (regulator of RpoE activity)